MQISELLFLGTGGSLGTPVIGCSCKGCRSSSPHNPRLRPSVLLTIEGKKIVIDPSPDFREVALRYQISSVDGILITHPHEDHIGGLNDMRPYYLMREGTPLPMLLSKNSYTFIHNRFSYAIDRFTPIFLPENGGTLSFLGIEITYFSYSQLDMPVTGYRIGSIAYITDIKEYPQTIFSYLQGLDFLVLGTINEKGAPMHFSLAEAKEFIKKASPKKTLLTHISHDVDVEAFSKSLPPNVSLAFDGASIPIKYVSLKEA